MKHHQIKMSDMKWLLPFLIFLISTGILYVIVHNVNLADYEQIRTKTELNAVTYADRMITDLNGGINITNSLEQILISENGEIGKFETVAQSMMADYVQSIQLAPGGVVTQIYPEAGNEAGKIDLIHDEVRGEIVNYGVSHNMIVMQGPFDLKQGGSGIAIRNPVFLHTEDGEEYFWGLTIVIIRVPDIFYDSVKTLSEFGYQYRLYKTESPLSTEYMLIDGSDSELTDPVSHSFTLGGCSWKIEVMPAKGWNPKSNMRPILCCGAAMILLLEGLTVALLIMEEQRKSFKRLAVTDGLTGIYNRTGFGKQLEHYFNDGGEKSCVGMMLDVDNFKFINDVYGHAVGDQVLMHLAKTIKETFYKNAIIGRNGGDEFCILLKDCSAQDVRLQIENFCLADRIFQYKGKEYNYSISLGYAEYPANVKVASELFRCADMALYEVKLKGKHNCLCYTNDITISERTQLGFKLNDISFNLPGAFFIYKADREDEEILYANEEMIRLAGCEDLDDFFEFTGKKFSNLIHPDELEEVEESIWKQILSGINKTNDYVQYRLATKGGIYKNVLDFGRIVENEYYGQVFYVLIIDYDHVKEHYRT